MKHRNEPLPPFTVRREPFLVTARVHCETCGLLTVCVYIPKIDRWLCEKCLSTVAKLSELQCD